MLDCHSKSRNVDLFDRLEDSETCPVVITHLLWVSQSEVVYCKSDGSQASVCHAYIDWNSTYLRTTSVSCLYFYSLSNLF